MLKITRIYYFNSYIITLQIKDQFNYHNYYLQYHNGKAVTSRPYFNPFSLKKPCFSQNMVFLSSNNSKSGSICIFQPILHGYQRAPLCKRALKKQIRNQPVQRRAVKHCLRKPLRATQIFRHASTVTGVLCA